VNELKYDSLEGTIDQRLDELSAKMGAGFARLEAQIESLRRPVWSGTISAFDGFEKRMTSRFFWYFMTQGIANAVIILGMLKLFGML
jgi:hypothetical protein